MTGSQADASAPAQQRLAVAHLSKAFGPTRALRDVQLRVAPGELHGLVGQNGCGKSTLVKILTGVYTPDPGADIAVDGRRLALPIHPMDQRQAGVAVVHQNLGLVDDRTVWENVRLGRYQAGRVSRRINRREEQRAVEEVLARLGRPIDVRQPVATLSAEDRAAVAIARAMQDHEPGGGLIIFDESTRALGAAARARFFELVRSLIDGGASVLLISHQLEEIVAATDRVTVLRDGGVVEGGLVTSEVDEAALTRMMLGRHLVTHGRVDSHARDSVVASVRGLAAGPVTGFDLDVKGGEIVGLTGLIGSGFQEAAEALGGARRADAGQLSAADQVIALDRRRGSTEEFIAAGVAFVPERRLDQGLAAELSLADNLTLPRVRRRGGRLRIGAGWQAVETAAMIAKLDIRPPHPDAPVGTLSGGNQQKVLLAKWLAGQPNLLVLHEPAQAVDVGARHGLIDAIREAARDGCGVLIASVDAADLAVLCDRVLVFRDGRVAAELTGDLDQDSIVHATFGTVPARGDDPPEPPPDRRLGGTRIRRAPSLRPIRRDQEDRLMDAARQDDRAVSSVAAAPEPAPPRDRRPWLAGRARHFAASYAVIGVWVAMIAVYAAAEPGLFFRVPTFQTIFSSQQPLVFMAMALLCTITVGEFVDLSVPAVFGTSATILPVLVVNHHWGVWPASVVAVLAALLVGVVNGVLVVVAGVNTIVVTLGMGTLLEGISLWMSDLNTISGLPASFGKIALTSVGGLPISFYYGVILVAGFAYLMAFTPLGRHMRFVGASREVSRLSGVRVNRIRFGSFVAAAALSGVGAVIAVAALGGYNPTTSDSYLLPVFAAVFLGTAIIEPGRFNPVGTFVGIYFLETGILGLQLLGLQAWVSPVFYGGVLVIAVTISTLLRRRTT